MHHSYLSNYKKIKSDDIIKYLSTKNYLIMICRLVYQNKYFILLLNYIYYYMFIFIKIFLQNTVVYFNRLNIVNYLARG